MESSVINKRLRNVRKQCNLTIEQASEKVGVDIRTYSRWERGKMVPHLRTLRKLCQTFNVSAEELGFTID